MDANITDLRIATLVRAVETYQLYGSDSITGRAALVLAADLVRYDHTTSDKADESAEVLLELIDRTRALIRKDPDLAIILGMVLRKLKRRHDDVLRKWQTLTSIGSSHGAEDAP